MNLSSNAHRRAATIAAKALAHSLDVTQSASTCIGTADRWSRGSLTHSVSDVTGDVVSSASYIGCADSQQQDAPRLVSRPGRGPSSSSGNAGLKARDFMLRCRSSRRPPSSSLSTHLHAKHYSTPSYAPPGSYKRLDLDTRTLSLDRRALLPHPDGGEVQDEVILRRKGGETRFLTSIWGPMEAYRNERDCMIRIPGSTSPGKALAANLKVIRGEEARQGFSRYNASNEHSITWDQILDLVGSHTQSQRADVGWMEITGPEAALIEIYYHFAYNPHHGLTVEYPVLQFENGHMTLQGFGHPLNIARQHIEKRVYGKVNVKEISHSGRNVTLGHRSSRRARFANPARRVEDVPKPGTWTVRSLAEYVDSLITARPPIVMRSDESSKDQAQAIINELLTSPDLRPFLSWHVFYNVLSFLTAQRKIPQSWELLVLMQGLDFPPSALFYNRLLFTAAQDQLPKVFHNILNRMLFERVTPDAGTWVALLLANTTVDFKQNIMRQVFDRFLFSQTGFERESAHLIIPFSFRAFLSTGGRVADYLSILDDIWGSSWITDAAVCELIDVIASRGTLIEAVRLVNHLRAEKDYRPSKAPLHALLKHCQRTSSADLAVWIVAYAAENWAMRATDHVIYERMFRIAWNSRMYSLLRVVWIYASSAGQLTFDMRKKIMKSLSTRFEAEEEDVGRRWMSSAGAVACQADPMSCGLSPAEIVTQQLAMYEQVKPRGAFETKLVEAVFHDKSWTQGNDKRSRDTEWKMRNAVPMSLRPLVKKHLLLPAVNRMLGRA